MDHETLLRTYAEDYRLEVAPKGRLTVRGEVEGFAYRLCKHSSLETMIKSVASEPGIDVVFSTPADAQGKQPPFPLSDRLKVKLHEQLQGTVWENATVRVKGADLSIAVANMPAGATADKLRTLVKAVASRLRHLLADPKEESLATEMFSLEAIRKDGLSASQVLDARRNKGNNDLTPPDTRSAFALWLDGFKDATIILLGIMAGISITLAVVFEGEWYDSAGILLAVVIATTLAFVSQFRSSRTFEALRRQSEQVEAKVVREGQLRYVPIADIVVGDIVLLAEGDRIPADGVIFQGSLNLDESLLTGEAEPVTKTAATSPEQESERDYHVFRGTVVDEGEARIQVLTVGDATELGRIGKQVAAADTTQTPLQKKLASLAGSIGKWGFVVAVLTLAALIFRAIYSGELDFQTMSFIHIVEAILADVILAVTIVVVAVPEGLPVAVTLSLAYAMVKLAKENTLVRQLVTCEALGSCDTICTDKTGTLTLNQMRVRRLFADGRDIDADAFTTLQQGLQDALVQNICVNSLAYLDTSKATIRVMGNRTEGAMLLMLHEAGIEPGYEAMREAATITDQVPFSSARKSMETEIANGPQGTVRYWKGAPEYLLDHCDRILTRDGERALTDADREGIHAWQSQASHDALRVLLLAERKPVEEGGVKDSWTLTAMVAIADALRPQIPGVIRDLRAAGIQVKMLTGDNLETAKAIGREAGIASDDDEVMDTRDYAKKSPEEQAELVNAISVFARSTPDQKYSIVDHLEAQGRVVAVTGDGTNDAPALTRATVGCAMGSGTEVAREASKVILLDDNFNNIVRGVFWGRALYENIQRFLQFQLTINVSALLVVFLGGLLNQGIVLTAVQLIWVNLIMDTFAALAYCTERPRPDILDGPPRRRDEKLINRTMWTRIWMGSLVITAIVLVQHFTNFLGVPIPQVAVQDVTYYFTNGWVSPDVYGHNIHTAISEGLVTTHLSAVPMYSAVTFTLFILLHLVNQILCRSQDPRFSGFLRILGNPVFIGLVVLELGVQIGIVFVGDVVFRVAPFGLDLWAKIGVIAIAYVLAMELWRWFWAKSRESSNQEEYYKRRKGKTLSHEQSIVDRLASEK